MKNSLKALILLLFTIISTSGFSQDNVALLGIKFGMSKEEVRKEFNQNKQQYQNIDLGGYLWRLYPANNSYDNQGKLTFVKVSPKGGGMGLSTIQARLPYKALMKLLLDQGYKSDVMNSNNEGIPEFKIGETYLLVNENLGKNMYVGTPPYGSNVLLNLVIGKYAEVKGDNKKNTAFGETDPNAMTSDDALAELKRQKDKLDLEIISQAEYDSVKAVLIKYIK